MTLKQKRRTLERMGEKYKRLAYATAHDFYALKEAGFEREAERVQELANQLHKFGNGLLDRAAFVGF